jgi:hypothetical protein
VLKKVLPSWVLWAGKSSAFPYPPKCIAQLRAYTAPKNPSISSRVVDQLATSLAASNPSRAGIS